jgi:hypothetical protein
LEFQRTTYESHIKDILGKIKEGESIPDCDFEDHLKILAERKVIYEGGDWKPFPHPDLAARKNYIKPLVTKYMEGIVVKRNKAKEGDQTRSNLLRRFVGLG